MNKEEKLREKLEKAQEKVDEIEAELEELEEAEGKPKKGRTMGDPVAELF